MVYTVSIIPFTTKTQSCTLIKFNIHYLSAFKVLFVYHYFMVRHVAGSGGSPNHLTIVSSVVLVVCPP